MQNIQPLEAPRRVIQKRKEMYLKNELRACKCSRFVVAFGLMINVSVRDTKHFAEKVEKSGQYLQLWKIPFLEEYKLRCENLREGEVKLYSVMRWWNL